jgi:hypothetical protein
MPTTDLTRARRRLAELEDRKMVLDMFLRPAGPNGEPGWCDALLRVARRMARELAREIREQELEVRRLALTGPWMVEEDEYPNEWGAVLPRTAGRWWNGPNAKAGAIAYAEKMNRGAGR